MPNGNAGALDITSGVRPESQRLWDRVPTVDCIVQSLSFCVEFVFLLLQLKKVAAIKLSELLGRDWASKWRTICNSKAGLSLRGVLAHGVIDVVFCALGGRIPVSFLKDRTWSSQTPWFSDAQRIVRLVFVGVAFVPRGSVDLGVEWSASNFRASSMLANQRAIGPFPRLRTMLVSTRLWENIKKENHLLEHVCSQFTYEKFPRTTQSTCKLVDAAQQHHNISQADCALIQVNVCAVETWEIYLAPCKSSDNEIFPESQACTAIQSPDLFTQVPTDSSPYLTTLHSSLATLSVEIVRSKWICACTAGWNFGPSRSNKFRFQPVNHHR